MAWRVKVGESWRYCDELTVNELTAIEEVSGQPWMLFNPWRSLKAAAAVLAAFMVRDGEKDDAAKSEVAKLTLRTVKTLFEYADDDDLPDTWEDGFPVVDPKAEVSPSTD